MIHRDVRVTDLDPATWRQIGAIARFVELGAHRPDEPGVLSILHEHGSVLRVECPSAIASLAITRVDDPQATARALFEQHPTLERVQIFEKGRLAAYSDAVQRLDWRALSLDEFYLRAWLMAADDPEGLCYYPPRPRHWNHFDPDQLRATLAALPDASTLILSVVAEGRPWFNLIAQVERGEIRRITTFAALARYGLGPRSGAPEDCDSICAMVARHIGPVALALFCDRETFERWLRAEDKAEVLAAAGLAGAAAWRQPAPLALVTEGGAP